MNDRRRIYDSILETHLETHRQMAFVSGPRQVGKTTVCRHGAESYFNWDAADDRRLIQKERRPWPQPSEPTKLAPVDPR